MQNPLKILGDLNKMRQQAAKIQKELEKLEFEVEKGRIKIVITGNQKVTSVQIDGQEVTELREAINEAIHKSQQAAAGQLQNMSQELGLGI